MMRAQRTWTVVWETDAKTQRVRERNTVCVNYVFMLGIIYWDICFNSPVGRHGRLLSRAHTTYTAAGRLRHQFNRRLPLLCHSSFQSVGNSRRGRMEKQL